MLGSLDVSVHKTYLEFNRVDMHVVVRKRKLTLRPVNLETNMHTS